MGVSAAAVVVAEPATEVTLDLRSPDAFRALALAERRALVRVAARLLGDAHGAEDAAQEALARAFERRAEFRGQARPLTWLVGFVLNVCRAELRRRRVRRWLSLGLLVEGGREGSSAGEREPLAPDAPLDAGLERGERAAAVARAVAALPDGQRAALVLVAQEGLTAGEAARLLGTTEAAVWQSVSRARRAVRKAVGEEGGA